MSSHLLPVSVVGECGKDAGEGHVEGFFEWIISFDDVKQYFSPRYTGFTANRNPQLIRVLEVGCGTSALAVDLSQKLHFGEVVSIDNDKGCVEHMAEAHRGVADVQWIVFDVIEDVHALTGTVLDHDSYFDMVVDKGTLDAVLVEGTIAPMLEWVKRKLKINGVYILFSIWSKSLLEPLFNIKELEYNVFIEEIAISEYKKGTVVICRKMSDDIPISMIDMKHLADEERAIMDAHFKEEHPLLTPELELRIRRAFEHTSASASANGGQRMNIKDVYDVVFGDMNSEDGGGGGGGGGGGCAIAALPGFTLDLFLEDLAHFERKIENELTLEETLEFIRQMQ